MEKDVFTYLNSDYRYLNNYIKGVNKTLFTTPSNSVTKGMRFTENLTQEVSRVEGYGLLNKMTQAERLSKLQHEGVLEGEISKLFHVIGAVGSKESYEDFDHELAAALSIHKNIYKITCWFVENYIDNKFEASPYESPIPPKSKASNINTKMMPDLIKKMENLIEKPEIDDSLDEQIIDDLNISEKEESEDILEDLIIESIIDNKGLNKKCLIRELSRLKKSSNEAVQGAGKFTPFKRYMHVERENEKNLEELIFKASKSNRAQLILVCGSVWDGKSHILSYLNNKHPDVMNNFTIHNNVTENLIPNKTSMDILNEVLDNFSDIKVGKSNEKLILAIDFKKLNAFTDSQYGEKFSILKKYVEDKKSLEVNIEESSFDEDSSFQFVNFSDYHLSKLKNGKIQSNYIKSLITKITDPSELNIFYNSYKKNCTECSNCKCCPIKANYELLSDEKVQESIIDLLVQCIIKNKKIISTRALINFIYEIVVPRSYIDVNSPIFKKDIFKLNNLDYIKSLMPNMIFNHKESSIFEELDNLDPLNVKNQKIDDFIVEFSSSKDILPYFKKYIDYPEGCIDKIKGIKVKDELLKLFMRSYYVCGKGDILF